MQLNVSKIILHLHTIFFNNKLNLTIYKINIKPYFYIWQLITTQILVGLYHHVKFFISV